MNFRLHKFIILLEILFIILLNKGAFPEHKTLSSNLVSDIQIQGLQNLSLDQIQRQIQWRTEKNKRFSEEKILFDINALYLTGYFHQVEYQLIPTQNAIIVSIVAKENPLIRKIEFEGNSFLKPSELKEALTVRKGTVFNTKLLKDDIDRLTRHFHQKGYDLFTIKSVSLSENHHLVFNISEGNVGHIRFKGLNTISSFVLNRNLALQPESAFNSILLKKDRLKILKLGYFSFVSPPFFQTGSNPHTVDIHFQLKEKKSNLLDLGLEQDSEKVLSFLQLNWNHLLLHSDVFSIKTQIGLDNQITQEGYLLRYYQPWIMNQWPISLALNGWNENKNQQNTIPEHTRTGYDIQLNFPIIQDTLSLTTKYKSEDITKTQNPYALQSIAGLLNFSTIENWVNPENGAYWTIEFEQGGDFGPISIGDINFRRLNINWALFFSPVSRHIFCAHAFAGILDNQEQLINTEQYSLGGSSSLRGYHESQFVGSKKISFNIEYRYLSTPSLQGILFCDIGQVFQSYQDLNVANLLIGKGIGFRIFTPVGPFRLDFASRPDDFIVHFNLGQVF